MPLPFDGGGSTTKPLSNHSYLVKTIAEIIAIAVMALLADLNEDLGRVLVLIMVGWLLVWLMLNGKQIQGLFGKLNG